MTWLKRALPAIAAGLLLAAPGFAQVGGHPVEVSAGAGLFKYDIRAHMKRGPAFMGTAGWRALPWLTLEAHGVLGPSKADTLPEGDHNFSYLGADLRWNLRPAENRVVPFLLTGAGYALSHTAGHPPDRLERGAGSLGLGVLYSLGHPRAYLRLQVRDVFFRDRDALEFSNDFAATVGLHWVFFGKFKDQDLDQVRDWLDKCPDTPLGCIVDRAGCPSDADADSVCDGNDKCPDTPLGCVVDANGCPIDSDGDGVCDGLDQCADTPKGCTVDAHGCPSDPDSDGVCVGLDMCPDTPKGCSVDAVGCTTDSDGDGVCDDLDRCLNTPTGTPIDSAGCPLEFSAFERMLLDSGVVRVKGVTFDAAQQAIDSTSAGELDSLGVVLQQYPMFKVEIGGPTDLEGNAAIRARLSLDQARAVIDYLKAKFPLIDEAQYALRGYAATETTPFAAKKRRIEFRVTNPEELPVERAKRNLTGAGGAPEGGEESSEEMQEEAPGEGAPDEAPGDQPPGGEEPGGEKPGGGE